MDRDEGVKIGSNRIEKVKDHGETSGPRVGVKLTLQQASLILNRHLNQPCKSIKYIERGFINRSYIVTSEDDQEFVIRLAANTTEWTRRKTEIEVATMIFLSKKSPKIPVPNVLGFCTDRERSGVGNEYILMEKLTGKSLDEVWNKSKDFEQKKVIIQHVVELLGKLKSIHFEQLGSLQFRKELSDTFGLGINLEKIDISNDIIVGPGLKAESGPFNSYMNYLVSSLKTELKYCKISPFLVQDPRFSCLIPKIQLLIEMLEKGETTFLSQEKVLNVPFVFTHGDFDMKNILMDEKTLKITGLVDFEFSGSFPIDDDWLSGLANFGADTSEWSIFNEEPIITTNHPDPVAILPVKEYFLEQCKNYDVLTPPTIPGHEIRALMYYFKFNISPWFLREKVDLVPESWYPERDAAKRRIIIVLEKFGLL